MAGRQLVFVQQPTRVRIPNAIWPPVRLEIRIGDHVDPKIIDGEVKLSILSGPPGGQIIGTSTARCPNGVATFDDLRFNLPGTYTLIAECDEDKLDLAGLEGHSSIVFFDMATGVDERNRLVCQRTGFVLNLQGPTIPTLIDSPLGEGTARRFIRSHTNYWQGTGRPPGLDQALADGAVVHVLYRQNQWENDHVATVVDFGNTYTFIRAGIWNRQHRQDFRYRGASSVTRYNNLENWSLLSLGGIDGVARCYINGIQSGPDFAAGTLSSGATTIGRGINGDIAQIGVEPVSSLEDMDAKALHAAQMCKVAP